MNEKLNRRPGKQDWGNTPIKRDRKIRENIEYVRNSDSPGGQLSNYYANYKNSRKNRTKASRFEQVRGFWKGYLQGSNKIKLSLTSPM